MSILSSARGVTVLARWSFPLRSSLPGTSDGPCSDAAPSGVRVGQPWRVIVMLTCFVAVAAGCTSPRLSQSSPLCAGHLCGGGPNPVPVSFHVMVNGVTANNAPLTMIRGGTTQHVTVSIDVPNGATVSTLEIGTGGNGEIGTGGPSGIVTVLLRPSGPLAAGVHVLSSTWAVPISEVGTTTHLLTYYRVTAPKYSHQHSGTSATDLATFSID